MQLQSSTPEYMKPTPGAKHLTEAVIVGGFPGFISGDGADDFSSSQVRSVLLCWVGVKGRHADDVVEETWVGPSANTITAFSWRMGWNGGVESVESAGPFTPFAVGVAHVVRCPLSIVMRVGRGRVDSNVLAPVHLTKADDMVMNNVGE